MAQKQITKDQHYVPKMYLKSFSGNDGRLRIFNVKDRRKAKSRTPTGVCYDLYYYGMTTGQYDETSQTIEAILGVAENFFEIQLPPILKKVRKYQAISGEEKYVLAAYMTHLWLRGPNMRKQVNRLQSEVLKFLLEARNGQKDIEATINLAETHLGIKFNKQRRDELRDQMKVADYETALSNHLHLDLISDPEKLRDFSNIISAQDWIFHHSVSSREFVTSDTPVAVITPRRQGMVPIHMIEKTHLFPLAPDILIEAFQPGDTEKSMTTAVTIQKGQESVVDMFNLQIARSSHWIYASRSKEIKWFENYVKQLPAIPS